MKSYREAVRELDEALTCDTLQPDDVVLLEAILYAEDMLEALRLIHAYYEDSDRADRTPRPLLYLHLGVLMGLAEKVIAEVDHE